MKQLVLMRHGLAAPFESPNSDFARPLERRGVADVASVTQRLCSLPWYPDLIVASAARRTMETARTVAQGFALPESSLRSEPRLYTADLEVWRTIARELDATIRRAVLIGHNPGVSQFAQWLLPTQRVAGLTPGTALLLDCRIEAWTELTPDVVSRAHRDAPS